MDPITSEKFFRMVEKINSDLNITVVLVEHSLEQAVYYVNRIILIESGQIKLDLKTDQALRKLYQDPEYQAYSTN